MLNAVRIWILLSSLLVASGWVLSAFHQLNCAGYGIVLALAAGALLVWTRKTGWRPRKNKLFQKFKRRFKRPAPMLFLILALLCLAAGSLYIPSDADSNAYRIPRVLHWLAAERWHWIRTLDIRMNVAGCNFEWLCAPLILLTRTDRCLFLLNWLSFLLLPGLIFSVFTRLRVSPRVAWWWMWLLPSGWCFIMQAGSTINDSFAAVFALAAVDLAFRARENRRVEDLWLAMLAASLVTGVKQTLILLALPGLIAIWPGLRLLLKRWFISAGVIVVSLLVSAMPITIFNLENTGSWISVSKTYAKAQLHSPFWGIVGNAFCLALENLKPPIFPFVGAWDAARKHFLQTPFGMHFAQFEDFGKLSFGVGETSAGIGLGISALIIISIFWAWRDRPARLLEASTRKIKGDVRLLIWVPWMLLLIFMAKNGSDEGARQCAAYYIFLFPSLLSGAGQKNLTRQVWWRGFAVTIMCIAAMLLVTSRDRPLFPAQMLMNWLQADHPNSKFISRAAYSYRLVPDFEEQRIVFEKIRPPGEKVVGLATVEGSSEPGLWLPYGQRKVMRILPGDTPEQLRQAEIRYVMLEDDFLYYTNQTLDQFLSRYHGTLVTTGSFFADTGEPQYFYLVHLAGNG